MSKQSEALFYSLKGLEMCSTVLHIGAHPDDEEISLLSYLRHKYGVRVVYWSATRGEGGQNKIGSYSGDALGVYRTWESEAVREEDGAECLFGPFVDFGYSKNGAEALEKWGRTNVIREIVRAIRLCQPHIVVARWSGTPTDQHGQHEAVGQVSEEAFDAAADPAQFPELQAQGLSSWRPLKLYLSEMRLGHVTSLAAAAALFGAYREDLERPGILRINCGEYDPVSAQTYQERAWQAYNKHYSQAMGWLPEPGDFFCYFSLSKSLVTVPECEQSFFDGFDPTLTGLATLSTTLKYDAVITLTDLLKEAKHHLAEAFKVFRNSDPSVAVAPLLDAHLALNSARQLITKASSSDQDTQQSLGHYLQYKISVLEMVIARCMGLQLQALAPQPRTTPGASIEITARLWNQGGLALNAIHYDLELPAGWHYQTLSEDESATTYQQQFNIQVAQEAELSCPYWLAKPRSGPYQFSWPPGEPSGRAMEPAPGDSLLFYYY